MYLIYLIKVKHLLNFFSQNHFQTPQQKKKSEILLKFPPHFLFDFQFLEIVMT